VVFAGINTDKMYDKIFDIGIGIALYIFRKEVKK